MSIDARKEDFEHIELFGKPALFTNSRIDRVIGTKTASTKTARFSG
ncbi:MAG: hypothetical protein PHE47_08665 [Oscillospiraceae bacterium]|nr:hypothetical protein [Oscillospiraceae bacterium]